MEHFVIIVNGWKPLTIITKRSIFDVASSLDPPMAFPLETISIYLIVAFKINIKIYKHNARNQILPWA